MDDRTVWQLAQLEVEASFESDEGVDKGGNEVGEFSAAESPEAPEALPTYASDASVES